LSIANVEGVGPRWDDYLFYNRSVDYSSAQATMISEFPIDFALLDAFEKTPDGMVGVMGHPKARSVHRLYASKDPLLLDLTVLNHLGISSSQCQSINELFYWYGDVPEKIDVRGDDSKIKYWRGPHSNDICVMMGLFATIFYETAGRGKLFLPRFDESQFPKKRNESIMVKWLRSLVLSFLNIPLYLPRIFK
jgi:hypothetical protein